MRVPPNPTGRRDVDVGAILSIRHQPLPATLHLWIGDADEARAAVKGQLQLLLAPQ